MRIANLLVLSTFVMTAFGTIISVLVHLLIALSHVLGNKRTLEAPNSLTGARGHSATRLKARGNVVSFHMKECMDFPVHSPR